VAAARRSGRFLPCEVPPLSPNPFLRLDPSVRFPAFNLGLSDKTQYK
jgi:hypothetical protein